MKFYFIKFFDRVMDTLTFYKPLVLSITIIFVTSGIQADETQRWKPNISGEISDSEVWENGIALPANETGYIYDGVQSVNDDNLSGNRTLQFTGGTTTFTNSFSINSSSFVLEGGTVNAHGSHFIIGNESAGSVMQSGNSVFNLNSVWTSSDLTWAGFRLGNAANSTYNLQSGTFNVTNGSLLLNNGTFTQTGGEMNVSNGSGLKLENNTSVFNLNGGSLNLNGAAYINAAKGHFNVADGGTINVTPTAFELSVGKKLIGVFTNEDDANNALAHINMTNGWQAKVVNITSLLPKNQTLNSNIDFQYLILAGPNAAPDGIKIWNATNTSNDMDNAKLWIGTTSDSTGYVFGGTYTFRNFTDNLIVYDGTNSFRALAPAGKTLIINGGNNTYGSVQGIVLSKGSVYLNSGILKTLSYQYLTIDGSVSAPAYVEVNGGLFNIGLYLTLGLTQTASSPTAKMVVNNGTVFCGNSSESSVNGLILAETMGSNAELTMNGGLFQIFNNRAVKIAFANNSTAKFTMTGGEFLTDGITYLGKGEGSTAEINISGGSYTSTNTIDIGTGSNATATLNISGGELSAESILVGRAGAGDSVALNITGGKVVIKQDLHGSDSQASGSVYISGSGSIVFDSNYSDNAAIRDLSNFCIEGAGDGSGALQFLNSVNCDSDITLTNNATIGIAEGAIFTQDAVIKENAGTHSGLTITGSGTLSLTQAPEYTGATSISNGTLTLATDSVLYNLTGGSADENGDIVDKATIIANGSTLTINNDEKTKYVGSITAKKIIKTGSGILQIYTGDEGQIDVENIVVSSGQIDIKGVMNAGLEIESGAIFSPGNSIGETTINGNYIQNDYAILLFEQDETGADKLIANSFNLAPNSIIELSFQSPAPGTSYEIMVQTGGNFSGQYANDAFWNALLSSNSAEGWGLSVNGNTVNAVFAQGDTPSDVADVPEPSTWVMLILGLISGIAFIRKNRINHILARMRQLVG